MYLNLFLLPLIVISAFAQQEISPRGVTSHGGTSFTYWGFHAQDTKTYALIEKYAEDVWHYAVNDTMWLDTDAVVIKGIDTVANKATIEIVADSSGRTRDSCLVGTWETGYIVGNNSILSVLHIDESTVSCRVYDTPLQKMFVFENDTVIFQGNKVTYIHFYEESLPIVNCRNIIFKDTVIDLMMSSFYLNKRCDLNPIWISGRINGAELKLTIEYNDKDVVEYLSLAPATDSIDITLRINETMQNPFDSTALTLQWICNRGESGPGNALGLRIVKGSSTTFAFFPNKKVAPKNEPFSKENRHDILGRRLGVSLQNNPNLSIRKKTKTGSVIQIH
jgi:hypothetical protein